MWIINRKEQSESDFCGVSNSKYNIRYAIFNDVLPLQGNKSDQLLATHKRRNRNLNHNTNSLECNDLGRSPNSIPGLSTSLSQLLASVRLEVREIAR